MPAVTIFVISFKVTNYATKVLLRQILLHAPVTFSKAWKCPAYHVYMNTSILPGTMHQKSTCALYVSVYYNRDIMVNKKTCQNQSNAKPVAVDVTVQQSGHYIRVSLAWSSSGFFLGLTVFHTGIFSAGGGGSSGQERVWVRRIGWGVQWEMPWALRTSYVWAFTASNRHYWRHLTKQSQWQE